MRPCALLFEQAYFAPPDNHHGAFGCGQSGVAEGVASSCSLGCPEGHLPASTRHYPGVGGADRETLWAKRIAMEEYVSGTFVRHNARGQFTGVVRACRHLAQVRHWAFAGGDGVDHSSVRRCSAHEREIL